MSVSMMTSLLASPLLVAMLAALVMSELIVMPTRDRELKMFDIEASRMSNLSSVPTLAWPLFGTRLSDNRGLWCGGISSFGAGLTEYHKYCYLYDFNSDTWSHLGNLASSRSQADLVLKSDLMSVWVLGGVMANDVLSSSETLVVVDDVYVHTRPGPRLPQRFALPCAVRVSNSSIFVSGTYYGRQYAFIFDEPQATFQRLDVSTRRAAATCGVLTDSEGRKQVLLAGGIDMESESIGYSDLVEMYDVSEDNLLESEKLPFGLFGGRPTDVEIDGGDERLYLLGGKVVLDEAIDDWLGILVFDLQRGWSQLQLQLEQPVQGQAALLFRSTLT